MLGQTKQLLSDNRFYWLGTDGVYELEHGTITKISGNEGYQA